MASDACGSCTHRASERPVKQATDRFAPPHKRAASARDRSRGRSASWRQRRPPDGLLIRSEPSFASEIVQTAQAPRMMCRPRAGRPDGSLSGWRSRGPQGLDDLGRPPGAIICRLSNGTPLFRPTPSTPQSRCNCGHNKMPTKAIYAARNDTTINGDKHAAAIVTQSRLAFAIENIRQRQGSRAIFCFVARGARFSENLGLGMRIELAQKLRVVLPAGDPRARDGMLCNQRPVWTDKAVEDDLGAIEHRPNFRELNLDAGTRCEIDDADFNWFRERCPGLLVLIDADEVDRVGGLFPGIARKPS